MSFVMYIVQTWLQKQHLHHESFNIWWFQLTSDIFVNEIFQRDSCRKFNVGGSLSKLRHKSNVRLLQNTSIDAVNGEHSYVYTYNTSKRLISTTATITVYMKISVRPAAAANWSDTQFSIWLSNHLLVAVCDEIIENCECMTQQVVFAGCLLFVHTLDVTQTPLRLWYARKKSIRFRFGTN